MADPKKSPENPTPCLCDSAEEDCSDDTEETTLTTSTRSYRIHFPPSTNEAQDVEQLSREELEKQLRDCQKLREELREEVEQSQRAAENVEPQNPPSPNNEPQAETGEGQLSDEQVADAKPNNESPVETGEVQLSKEQVADDKPPAGGSWLKKAGAFGFMIVAGILYQLRDRNPDEVVEPKSTLNLNMLYLVSTMAVTTKNIHCLVHCQNHFRMVTFLSTVALWIFCFFLFYF